MKILISGGGTGGHIYPAIAIANKMKEEIKDAEILFVGTNKGLESQLVPKAGYPLKTITVSGFKRKLSFDIIKSVRDLFFGLKDSFQIIKSFKPDLVIGTGGYVCGPVVFIASLLKIKTVIHEQNVIPGVTNKILGKHVNKIFVSFEESRNYFTQKEKIIVTGNPVRKDFLDLNKKLCRQKLGILDDRLVVMVFGGSRGAEKLNNTMIHVLKHFAGKKDIYIYHITGEKHYDKVINSLDKTVLQNDNVVVKSYIHEMPKLMGACDLVVSRAGAITLAEITVMGLPSILIPSPYVTNNHQEHNARVLEKNGASIVVLEKELEPSKIINLLNFFLKDRDMLTKMELKSSSLAKSDATELIYKGILKVLRP